MIKMIRLLIWFISITAVANVNLPDAGLTTDALIRYWGYPAETHEVITDDGYILTLHRIPHGRKNHATTDKDRPVFLMLPGMIGSSASYVVNLPEQSLGFVLADAGFDVWLGNPRGNTYSRRHVSLSNTSNAFWDFTFDEMAKYDLPAMLNYVLKYTHQEQVYYVGYSQGNMIAFAGLSENIELQKKIKVNIALGPVTKMHHMNFLLELVAELEPKIRRLFERFNVTEILTATAEWYRGANLVCLKYPLLCDTIFWLLAGYDRKNLNETRVPLYVTYIPAGTSAKNFIQYLQIINVNTFRKYDYGVKGNLQHYTSIFPPEYDIRKVRTPTVLMYGSEDVMATSEDAKWMAKRLPNVIADMEIKDYNHLDFIWAVSAGKVIHQKIVEIVREVQKS